MTVNGLSLQLCRVGSEETAVTNSGVLARHAHGPGVTIGVTEPPFEKSYT
jgi:hypothetical protein